LDSILECVPNISEGRDNAVINKIVAVIKAVEGVQVLHIDIGYDANRTVLTFAGTPLQVIEAAYQVIAMSIKLIDMKQHTGAHPRMGAVDVCPLIPVRCITMEEAISLSHQLADRVGGNLHIPVFLYEKSQRLSYRKKLESIRKGEYEGWALKIRDPLWRPDFGPSIFDEHTGCIAIGVRNFLIAYNINLATSDVAVAKRIAGKIRGSGYQEIIGGNTSRITGRFMSLKAIGWNTPAFHCTQVSTNITDMSETPLHIVFEAVKEEAGKEGVTVNGSELVGLVPEEAILAAGEYYANKGGLKKRDYIEIGQKELGLNSVKPFIPASHILEWKMGISGE